MAEPHWMGRPLSELSREELLGVVDWLGERLRRHESPEAIHASAIGQVQMLKAGLRCPALTQEGQ